MGERIDNKQKGQPLKGGTANDVEKSQVDVILKLLTISVFFDGTRNNRFNTEAGIKNPALKTKDVSYDNYYSNVALLYMAMEPTEKHQKIYIQGAGTYEGEEDEGSGLGMAEGKSGVIARVGEACKLVEALRKKAKANRLVINIYGFSRGAAYGRFFCSRLKGTNAKDGFGSGGELARIWGIQLDAKNIKINFMGLFDTVSSFGMWHYSNVKSHRLDVGREGYEIRYIVHLTAQNDYRKHFPLTPIKAAVKEGIGFECSFPGAHSDIGGGYPAKWSEDKKYLGFKVAEATNNDKFISWEWFRNKGYYLDNQISEKKDVRNYRGYKVDLTTIYGTRQTTFHYQFILAEIMGDMMKKETYITYFSNAILLQNIAEMKAIPLLKVFRDKAYAYVLGQYKTPGAGFQVPMLSPEQMKRLYNGYIHHSLTYELELTNFNPNEGTSINKRQNPKGGLDYMNPTRPMVTKGFKYT